jgi:hypothetical protein
MTHQGTNTARFQDILGRREADLERVVQAACGDDELLEDLLAGLAAKEDTLRFNCFQALLALAGQQPSRLYPAWDSLVGLLASDNSYHRSIAVQIIPHLLIEDDAHRFEAIFDRYFGLLDDESVIAARYLAQNAGRIAKSRPDLRRRITERLLDVDETHHAPARKDLLKGDIVQALAEFFEEVEDQGKILAFVRQQVDSGSPRTRKAAKAFLKKYAREQS